jgi:hypothetical protein
MPVTEMKDHVYKILELVGSSEKRGCHSKCYHPRIRDHSRDEMGSKSCKREAISKMGLSDIIRSLCELDSR